MLCLNCLMAVVSVTGPRIKLLSLPTCMTHPLAPS